MDNSRMLETSRTRTKHSYRACKGRTLWAIDVLCKAILELELKDQMTDERIAQGAGGYASIPLRDLLAGCAHDGAAGHDDPCLLDEAGGKRLPLRVQRSIKNTGAERIARRHR